MLAFIAAMNYEFAPCERSHKEEGPPADGNICEKTEIYRDIFVQTGLQIYGATPLAIPQRWACITFVKEKLEHALAAGVVSLADPLMAFAGKRKTLRRTSDEKERGEFLRQQTLVRIPKNMSAIYHLEAQGYICVRCNFEENSLTYWYENPTTGWVAYLEADIRTEKLLDSFIAPASPETYHSFILKGVKL